MMEFLRGLAPQRAHDPGRAVAALPSRFEQVRPIRRVLADAVSPSDHSEPEPAPTTSLPVPVSQSVESTAPSSPASKSAATIQVVINEAPAEPRPVRTPVVAARVSRHDVPHDTTERQATPSSQDGSPLFERLRPAARDAAVLAPSSIQAVSPVASAPARVELTHSDGDASRPASAAQAPMSSRAMAERTPRSSDERPVIHVTIDRLEVRAPAAPARAPQPSRSRPASPSVPLSEYLRTREPRRRGGVS